MVEQFGDYAEGLHNEVERLCREHKKDLQREMENSSYQMRAMVMARQFSQSLLDFDRPDELVFMSKEVNDCLKSYQTPPSTDPPGWRQPRINPPDHVMESAIAKYFGTLTFEGEVVKSVLIREFSTKVEGDAKEPAVCDVAMTDDNEIVVVDRENRKVKVFSTKGVLKMSVGNNHLRQPNRTTNLKSSGMILVKDEKRLNLFAADGRYCGTFAELLKQPVGLTQTKDGEVLITDWASGEVHGFSENGEHMRCFPCASEGPGYICSAPNGNIIISDWKQHIIKVFNTKGKFLFHFGSEGSGRGQVNHPYGVCSDKYGNIIIADTWNHRIHLVAGDGRFLSYIVTKDDGIVYPQSVVVDNKGNLIIAERTSIKVYQYLA